MTEPCGICGARPSDEYTDSSGHFLVNDEPCPRSIEGRMGALESRESDNTKATVLALQLLKDNLSRTLDAAIRRIEDLERHQHAGPAGHFRNTARPPAPIDDEDV